MGHRSAALALVGLVLVAGVAVGAAPTQPKGDSGASKLDALKEADWKEALIAAKWLEKVYEKSTPPEAVRMLIAIANGSWAKPDAGWFGPCETRYTWDWLARHHESKESSLSLKKFKGSAGLFRILDRNRDGVITADDLDWSDRSPYMRQLALVHGLFARINSKRDGKITAEEWQAFFRAASDGKDHLTPDDLRNALLGGSPSVPLGKGDMPTQAVLVRSLFAGELGSLNEGPAVDQQAPDFALKIPDGKQTSQLSKLIGPKPVVLVFGNFTCPPFRRTCMSVEELHQRYKERATFLGVYVREAHPTDGWAMAANKTLGITVKQPTTYADRAAVCTTFCQKVKPTFPFVVDEINDPVGNAYSGMPGRLYVIDQKGKVAYKSGRGPFGFRVGELEQALVMALLESGPAVKSPAPKTDR